MAFLLIILFVLQYSNTKAYLAVKLFSISFDHVYRDIMNNKVFYQHPNLMRTLGMHETVMEVMVNVLGEGESKVQYFGYNVTQELRHKPLSVNIVCFTSTYLHFLLLGDYLSKDGSKLLSIPVLFLPHQLSQSRSAF